MYDLGFAIPLDDVHEVPPGTTILLAGPPTGRHDPAGARTAGGRPAPGRRRRPRDHPRGRDARTGGLRERRGRVTLDGDDDHRMLFDAFDTVLAFRETDAGHEARAVGFAGIPASWHRTDGFGV
jgi:hypothetical protein